MDRLLDGGSFVPRNPRRSTRVSMWRRRPGAGAPGWAASVVMLVLALASAAPERDLSRPLIGGNYDDEHKHPSQLEKSVFDQVGPGDGSLPRRARAT